MISNAPSRSDARRAATLLGAALAAALPAPGLAQTTTQIPVAANVVRATSAVGQDMDFGAIIPGAVSGTVTMTPTAGGGLSVTGTNATLVGTAAERRPGVIFGTSSTWRVQIRLSSLTTTLRRVSSTETMLLDRITMSVENLAPVTFSAAAPAYQITFLPPRTGYSLRFGGTLTVPPGQRAGDYEGDVVFSVSVF